MHHSSVDKESTCNAEDPSLIPGSGKSTGKGIGYPLQYSWASLVAQMVNNLLSMQETRIQSLGWEDSLEKGKATHSNIPAWKIPWREEPGRLQCMGSQRVGLDWAANTFINVFIETYPHIVSRRFAIEDRGCHIGFCWPGRQMSKFKGH